MREALELYAGLRKEGISVAVVDRDLQFVPALGSDSPFHSQVAAHRAGLIQLLSKLNGGVSEGSQDRPIEKVDHSASATTLIGEIPIKRRERLRITMQEFRGRTYLSVRIFALGDKEWVPTKKGITVDAKHTPAIRSLLDRALPAG